MPIVSQSTSRRAFMSLVGITASGIALAGCASPDNQAVVKSSTDSDLVARAKAEGSLMVYATMPLALLNSLTEAFEKKYAIKVVSLRIAVSQMMPRFASEMEGGIVNPDILQISLTDFLDDAIKKGWIAKTDIKDVPDVWGKNWNGYYAKLATGPIIMSYNTDILSEKDVPTSWEDVLDPKWKGKILFVDPTAGTTWTPWIYLMQQKYGDDFLRGLARQDLKVVKSNVAGSQQLAAGEASFLLPTSPWAIQDLVKQGAPVANAKVIAPTVELPHYVSAVKSAPRPAAAKLFMEYCLSVEGQTAIVSSGYAASVFPNIAGEMTVPEGTLLPSTDGNAHLDEYKRLLGLV